MQESTPIVTGKDGLLGELVGSPGTRGEGTCEVILQGGRRVVMPAEFLQARSDGSFYLPLSLSELEGLPPASMVQKGIVIPLAQEQLAVGKRKMQTGGVRVSTHTREHEEVVDVPLEREDVEVERVEVGKVVEAAPDVRREGDTLIVPLVEEVLVVEKRLVLREEVRLTTRRSQTHQPRRVKLRSEEAEIERIGPASVRDQA